MPDLSPEKLIVLLAVGLVVLGPHKLPAAARSLAHGLVRARHLAAALTDPMTASVVGPVTTNLAELAQPLKTGLTEPLEASLAETHRALDGAVADLRASVAAHPVAAHTRGSSVTVDFPLDPGP